MMGLRALIALGAVGMALGCARYRKLETVDLSAARLPATAKIVIDGRADEPAWKEAVAIPLEETGKARFLWDEGKLYGFVEKYERRFGFGQDEQICVLIWSGRRCVKLFLEEERPRDRPPALALRQAWAADWPAETRTREALASDSLEVASFSDVACRGFPWSFEFSVNWDCLSDAWTPGGGASVVIYRLTPQPLTTRVGRIERARAEAERQPMGQGNAKAAPAQD